jgi:hypothetical protein
VTVWLTPAGFTDEVSAVCVEAGLTVWEKADDVLVL